MFNALVWSFDFKKQSESRIQKETTNRLQRLTLHSTCHVNQNQDQIKALNIPFTLTQGDLLQEALAVTFAKDQTQALNIPVKVPLGGGKYAEL
jgi:hypothetical protein